MFAEWGMRETSEGNIHAARRRDPEMRRAGVGQALQPHLVLLVLLQELAAVSKELLQAQLWLPALPHALGEVCHQAAGTREQSLGPPSTQFHPTVLPGRGGKTVPHTIYNMDLTLPSAHPRDRYKTALSTVPGMKPTAHSGAASHSLGCSSYHFFQMLICLSCVGWGCQRAPLPLLRGLLRPCPYRGGN